MHTEQSPKAPLHLGQPNLVLAGAFLTLGQALGLFIGFVEPTLGDPFPFLALALAARAWKASSSNFAKSAVLESLSILQSSFLTADSAGVLGKGKGGFGEGLGGAGKANWLACSWPEDKLSEETTCWSLLALLWLR